MKKVLIIEDDPIMRHICQRLLGEHGFTVELATDGSNGLERLSAFQPDVVFLDLMMPKTSGIEVLKKLRAQEQFRNLPVIVFTNACVPIMVEQATKAGATHVLDKSKFNPVAIMELLRSAIDSGRDARGTSISLTERLERLH
jgi:CheY-like chemotaxis protein